jgi:hypothetical protein
MNQFSLKSLLACVSLIAGGCAALSYALRGPQHFELLWYTGGALIGSGCVLIFKTSPVGMIVGAAVGAAIQFCTAWYLFNHC